MTNGSTRHEIYFGKRDRGDLALGHLAGEAFLDGGARYYAFYLMHHPDRFLYLVRNREGGQYTVFSKMRQTEDGEVFMCPCGAGRISEELQLHLEIYLPLYKQQFYMSMYPAN